MRFVPRKHFTGGHIQQVAHGHGHTCCTEHFWVLVIGYGSITHDMNSSTLISAIDSGDGDAVGLHLGLLANRVEECLAGMRQGLGAVRSHENLLFEVVATCNNTGHSHDESLARFFVSLG
jgi:hypothetical protein